MRVINLNVLSNIPRGLTTPALISSVLVLPFLILELVNRPAFPQSFPLPLFAVMWLLPLSFILIVTPFAGAAGWSASAQSVGQGRFPDPHCVVLGRPGC